VSIREKLLEIAKEAKRDREDMCFSGYGPEDRSFRYCHALDLVIHEVTRVANNLSSEPDSAALRLDLERTQKQLQAALAANLRLDERIVELINQRDRFQRLFESVDQSNNELVFRLNNLPAQPRLSDSDRQKLFSVCRTVTEVIAGRPAQPGAVLTDAEVGEIFKAAHSSDSD
jgi:DNA repair exonuclease SbcCD ATPase subunit